MKKVKISFVEDLPELINDLANKPRTEEIGFDLVIKALRSSLVYRGETGNAKENAIENAAAVADWLVDNKKEILRGKL
jgi:hypothetical protein